MPRATLAESPSGTQITPSWDRSGSLDRNALRENARRAHAARRCGRASGPGERRQLHRRGRGRREVCVDRTGARCPGRDAYHPASVFDIRPRLTQPRGGWVRIYPLGPGGFPAMPGRFYPATGALCFSWNQLSEPANCARLGTPHRLLAVANRARLFHGRSTAITSVLGARDVNLVAAIQLAFDRYRARRTSHPPAKCLSFTIVWSGPKASRHPSRICISRHGVHARGVLYRGNPALWRLALANH